MSPNLAPAPVPTAAAVPPAQGLPAADCACGRRHGASEQVGEGAGRGELVVALFPGLPGSPPAPTAANDLDAGLDPRLLPPPERPLPKRTRRKLWEIPHKYHCPVIGTCLSVAELRRIGDRHALRADIPGSDYEVHVSFVAHAEDKNSLSLAIHKALERKFQGTVRRFERARDPAAVLALWSECVARGEVAAALWALMTHPQADTRVQRTAYEEIHMLSHQVGAGNRADLKRLADTQAELAALRRDFDALSGRARRQGEERDALIRDLEDRLAERDAALAGLVERERRLAARVAELESALDADRLGRRVAALEGQLADLATRLAAARAEAERAGTAEAAAAERAERAERDLEEKAAEGAALERLLAETLGGDAGSCNDCPDTGCPDRVPGRGPHREPARDLAGRLILCVGGRLPHVRGLARLVGERNGRFDHHDGGLEDRDRRLEALLAGADAVICATDCVSHAAYHRTKRWCKRHAKPHVLLPHSGLAAFALALERVAEASGRETLDGRLPVDAYG